MSSKLIVRGNPLRFAMLALAGVFLRGPAFAEIAMFRSNPSHAGVGGADSVELGEMAWYFATGGEVRSTPAIADGLVVWGSSDGWLYAVDLRTGAAKWKLNLGGPVTSSPAIAGQQILVMSHDGRLRALRLADGGEMWTFATGPDSSLGNDPRTFDIWDSSPTVANGSVYVGSGDNKVYAVDLATGRERWAYATRSRVRASPAVADGAVLVGSFDGCVYALDSATGQKRWEFQTGDAVQSSAAVMDGVVYVGSRAMAVFALDAKTGTVRWRRPHSGSWILASPAVAKGKVVIGGSDSHRMEALDAATGVPLWSVDIGARALGSPAIIGNVVAYAAEDFRAYTLDLATGFGLSIEVTDGAVYGSVVPTEGMMLVGSDDHNLYAFRTRKAVVPASSASAELLRAFEGEYRTESGDDYVLAMRAGCLGVTYCTYPPALAVVQADGTFSWPMLWGTAGKGRREPGKPVGELVLSQYGRTVIARRVAAPSVDGVATDRR